MPRKIAPETRWLAKMLYCVDRLSVMETAKRAGVSAATVKAWANRHQWREEREALASREAQIHADIVKARTLALQKLLNWEGDKETALALSAVDKLERLALAAATSRRAGSKTRQTALIAHRKHSPEPSGTDRPSGSVSDAERLALLEEAVNKQIAHVLHAPVQDMSARIRDIKAGLELLASFRGKDAGKALRVSFDE